MYTPHFKSQPNFHFRIYEIYLSLTVPNKCVAIFQIKGLVLHRSHHYI